MPPGLTSTSNFDIYRSDSTTCLLSRNKGQSPLTNCQSGIYVHFDRGQAAIHSLHLALAHILAQSKTDLSSSFLSLSLAFSYNLLLHVFLPSCFPLGFF